MVLNVLFYVLLPWPVYVLLFYMAFDSFFRAFFSICIMIFEILLAVVCMVFRYRNRNLFKAKWVYRTAMGVQGIALLIYIITILTHVCI